MMSLLLRKMLSRVYREAEDGNGSSGAEGAAPAGGSSEDSSADWEGMSDGVEPGSDDDPGDETDSPADEESGSGAADDPSPKNPATGEEDPAEKDPAKTDDESEELPKDPSELKQETPEEVAAREKQLQEDYAKWEQAEVEKLSKDVYAFDEETATRLQTEPELVLPKLAAQLEIRATRRALEIMQRMIPQLVPQVVDRADVEKKAAADFYGKNPDLKKYHKQVLEAGQMFRRLNPKATPEEAIVKIGKLVRDSLGLATPEGAEVSKPAAKTTPHKPANAGSTSARSAAKPAANEWSDLLDDD